MILITTLGEQLRCFLTERANPERIVLNDVQYNNEEGGDWTGFYDFLRNQQGKILGIRYFHLDNASEFLLSIGHRSYIRVLPSGAVELFFSSDRSYVPEHSADQDFGDNMLLRSASGEYAITFGLGALSPAELAQIQILAQQPC